MFMGHLNYFIRNIINQVESSIANFSQLQPSLAKFSKPLQRLAKIG